MRIKECKAPKSSCKCILFTISTRGHCYNALDLLLVSSSASTGDIGLKGNV